MNVNKSINKPQAEACVTQNIYNRKNGRNNLFKATVIIKRRPSILDPQGKAVEKGAEHLGLNNVKNTRIGKYIEFNVDINDKAAAEKEVEEYCRKLLANPIMEDFEFTLDKVS
ncbi:MAG: phosphoribosylformylglycinamidine synthase subunit PurS [Ignavibacteriaceae bacterium]